MAEKITILTEKQNPMFNRKELVVSINTNVSPKISEAEAFIAKEFSSSAENVKVRKIKGRFGSTNFVITANIYSSKEEKDKIEDKAKKEKKKKEGSAK
jgi:ribosomal protein S24E